MSLGAAEARAGLLGLQPPAARSSEEGHGGEASEDRGHRSEGTPIEC